ncbi:hypothetical protein Ciccas_012607 [Cichlidogyrus casuarinus]|uniref:Battenin n=1 Tax=Cichlidogyrus casuarinus TaxID=1844966 RepID=A0ABD2PPQ5_9PLAT
MSSFAFGLGTVTFMSLVASYQSICVFYFVVGSAVASTLPVYKTEPWIVPYIPKNITIAISGFLMAASLLVYTLLLPTVKLSNFSWRSLILCDVNHQTEPRLCQKFDLYKAMFPVLLTSALYLYFYYLIVSFYYETQYLGFVRVMSYLYFALSFFLGCANRKTIIKSFSGNRLTLFLPQMIVLLIFVLYAFFPHMIFNMFIGICLFAPVGMIAGMVYISTFYIILEESPEQFTEFRLVVAAAVDVVEVFSSISAPLLMLLVCKIQHEISS